MQGGLKYTETFRDVNSKTLMRQSRKVSEMYANVIHEFGNLTEVNGKIQNILPKYTVTLHS